MPILSRVRNSMNLFTHWLQRTTMYRLMLYYLLALLVTAIVFSWFGIFGYDTVDIVAQTLVFVGVCWGVNRVATRLLRIPSNIESSLITGLILAAIAGPLSLTQDWLVVLVMAGAAIGSKYVLVINRSHILNPAAFGVTVSALMLGYPASWWVGSQALLPVIVIGGVLVMAKIRRWHLLLSFISVYLGLLGLEIIFIQGSSLVEAGILLQKVATSAALLFFLSIMLVEPLTAPQTRGRRMVFGAFVAVALFALQRFLPAVPYSLEAALLFGNIFARIINPDFRQVLVLRHKEWWSAAIGNFWFEPTRRFAFRPGQFLEYTFAHPQSDRRGIRRFFSIASSPTESQVLLTARFSQPSSTFKQALHQMNEGDEIVAAKVAGDFVLPKDTTQKLAFIAGGIGITPFRSMVKYLLDTNERRDFVLLYGVRAAQDFVYRDIFAKAYTQFGMRTVYVTGQPIDADRVKKELPDFHERLFYVSGPEPMVQVLSKGLVRMGISRWRIKRDYFSGYPEHA